MDFDYSVNPDWYIGVYHDKKAPVKAGRPFSLIHSTKSDKAVLCIHGYTGYPGEVVRPARDLFTAGFDVYAPRLPGHGTTGKDFFKSTAKDWVSVCINAAKSLANEYDSVYVIGHSMGGGIAAIVASEVPAVKRLVLAAPAVANFPRQLPMNPTLIGFISLFVHKVRHKWAPDPSYKMYYEDAPADDLYLGAEYWSWLYPRQLYHLFKLMVYAGNKCLPKIKCPTLVICSMKDQVVGTATSDLAMEKLECQKRRVDLENGTHYLFYDKDKSEEDKAVNAVLEFLLRTENNSI